VENDQITTRILDRFGNRAQKLELNPPQAAIAVPADCLLELLSYIKEDSDLGIDYLSSLSAVDYLDQGLEMVYHFCSTRHHHRLTIKVRLNRQKPEIPTIIPLFPAANWYEREAWELFGVNIIGHPRLETLLLPEDWDQGWPMRRDWNEGKDFIRMPEL